MPLKAILIRAEGALAEPAEIERLALNRVFTEAGYPWSCERRDFATVLGLPTRRERVSHLVTERHRRTGSDADRESLILAIKRRLDSTVDDILRAEPLRPRAGIMELISEAKSEGIAVGLITAMSREELAPILAAIPRFPKDRFDVIVTHDEAPTLSAAYAESIDRLRTEAAEVLAIEASARGLAAATAHRVPAVVVRSPHREYGSDENLEAALAVVKMLPGVVTPPLAETLGPLGPEQRSELLSALRRLHVGVPGAADGMERSSAMRVSEILTTKGSAVKTIASGETIRTLALRLRSEAVGAMVVLSERGEIEGIISERDIARGLAEHGPDLPAMKVQDLMTKGVIICSPDDSIVTVSRTMTQRRIRHLPVLDQGKLVGLISIGDVLNHRLDQMQQEVNVLRDYAIARR